MLTNNKILITAGLVVILFVSGLLGFVVIPNELNKFKGASWESGTSTLSVSGNGGTAVQVGHYLYFTSGYKSKEDIKYKQNEYNKEKLQKQGNGGIWRVKMSQDEVAPTYDNRYLFDHLNKEINLDPSHFGASDNYQLVDLVKSGIVKDNETATEIIESVDKRVRKKDIELIVPKIAGWEDAALWIFGNTLIYTTPNKEQNRNGELRRDRIDYYRCDLTGKNHDRIYTTRTDNTEGQVEHTAVWAGNKPYLLVKDGKRLVRVSMDGDDKTFASNVSSHVFPIVHSYYKESFGSDLDATRETSFGGIMGYVFYTINEKDGSEIQGNKMYRYDIKNNRSTLIAKKSPNDTHRLLSLGNGKLIYEIDTLDNRTDLYITGNANVSHNDMYKKDWSLKDLNLTQVAVAGERTSTFQYITVSDGDLRVWKENSFNDIQNKPTELSKNQPIASDVQGVLAITPSKIIYEAQGGGYKAVGYAGGTPLATNTKIGSGDYNIIGGRASVFHRLNKSGARVSDGGDYMLFFGMEVPEAGSTPEVDDEGNTTGTPSGAKFKSSMMMTLDGEREFTLARLDTKFIKLPQKRNFNNND